jgi:tRNA/rRNA methyltransferase
MEISFLLIEPAVPENIGAAARALNTMGFHDFRLINPTNHLADEAKWLAHGSHDILNNAMVFNTFNEAIADLDFIIGTTAKQRSVKNDYYSPEKAKDIMIKKGDSIKKVGIVFGREESGLTNEELLSCDIASTVTIKTPYPSINLAQSVMLYAYIFSTLDNKDSGYSQKIQNQRIYHELKSNAHHIFTKLQISEDSVIYHRILERIATSSEEDAKLLLSFAKYFKSVFD